MRNGAGVRKDCTTAQFFVLNSTADYFVSLALEKPDHPEDKPDNPEDAAGTIEQLEVGRSAYVDVLRGKVLWPNERLPGGLIVTCVYPCAMVRGRVTGFFRLIEKEVPTSEQPYRLDLLSQVSKFRKTSNPGTTTSTPGRKTSNPNPTPRISEDFN